MTQNLLKICLQSLPCIYSIFVFVQVAKNEYIRYSYSVRYLETNIFGNCIWSGSRNEFDIRVTLHENRLPKMDLFDITFMFHVARISIRISKVCSFCPTEVHISGSMSMGAQNCHLGAFCIQQKKRFLVHTLIELLTTWPYINIVLIY